MDGKCFSQCHVIVDLIMQQKAFEERERETHLDGCTTEMHRSVQANLSAVQEHAVQNTNVLIRPRISSQIVTSALQAVSDKFDLNSEPIQMRCR